MRYWMAPDGSAIERNDGGPLHWNGAEGREVIPVVVGSREHKLVMAMREADAHLYPPPLRRGERVKARREGGEYTGPYYGPAQNKGHWLGVSRPEIWMDTVERIEGGEG